MTLHWYMHLINKMGYSWLIMYWMSWNLIHSFDHCLWAESGKSSTKWNCDENETSLNHLSWCIDIVFVGPYHGSCRSRHVRACQILFRLHTSSHWFRSLGIFWMWDMWGANKKKTTNKSISTINQPLYRFLANQHDTKPVTIGNRVYQGTWY